MKTTKAQRKTKRALSKVCNQFCDPDNSQISIQDVIRALHTHLEANREAQAEQPVDMFAEIDSVSFHAWFESPLQPTLFNREDF